jgi:hypothetical protein
LTAVNANALCLAKLLEPQAYEGFNAGRERGPMLHIDTPTLEEFKALAQIKGEGAHQGGNLRFPVLADVSLGKQCQAQPHRVHRVQGPRQGSTVSA